MRRHTDRRASLTPKARRIRNELLRIAARRGLTTYTDIAPTVGWSMPGHRNVLAWALGEISTWEHERGRPLLTAIVVHQDDGQPGSGFFELARTLGRLHAGDELAFFCREVARVHGKWSARARKAAA